MEEKENTAKEIKASNKLSVISRKLGLISFFDVLVGICFILFLVMSNFHSPNAIIMTLVQLLIVLMGVISLCGIPAVILAIIGFIRCKKWNFVDKRNAKIAIVTGALSITFLCVTIFLLDRARKSSLLISCANHRSFLCYELANNIPGNDLNHIFKLPYDPKLPGYGVFAKYTNHGTPGPYTACNHGAPNNWFGGWQALNLPQDKLIKLHDKWVIEVGKLPDEQKWEIGDMPYAWCGKPTGFKARECLKISFGVNGNDSWLVHGGGTNEDEITLLNKCLQQIGESIVSFNIPDNVDWGKYLNKKSNKKDASNSDSAVAKPE